MPISERMKSAISLYVKADGNRKRFTELATTEDRFTVTGAGMYFRAVHNSPSPVIQTYLRVERMIYKGSILA